MKTKLAVAFLILFGIGGSTFAQGIRFDSTVVQQVTTTVVSGATNVITVPAAPIVKFCNFPANAVPCTNLATTFTTNTLGTPCNTSTQITLVGSTTCVASPDANGNFGFWAASGQYSYTVTLPGGINLGPYNVTLGIPAGTNLSLGSLTTSGPNNLSGGGALAGAYTHSGTETFTGNVVPKVLDNVQIVDSTLSRGGSDIGAEINLAYAALPAGGGTIVVMPGAVGSCYSYSTPIVAATSGKYLRLEAWGASGATGLSTIAGCLNYTPTTATSAITLDYVPTAQSPLSSAHGLRNITLTNSTCLTSGGCASSAIGINTGLTNAGTWGATMDNVGIVGFGVGYNNANNLSVQIHWRNPQFVFNTVAAKTDQMTGFWVDAGQIEGNGTGFAATGASSQTEYIFNGPSFFSNTAVDIDVSASSAIGSLFCGACHFEKAGSAANARTINGPLNIVLDGGLMETDKTIGTDDWMINASGSLLDIRGMRFLAFDTVTSIIVANSPVRGQFNGSVISQGHFTNRITGANAANISDCSFAGSSTAAAASPCYFEAPFQMNGQASQPAGKAGFANLFYYPADSALEFNLNNAGNFKVAATNLAQSFTAAQAFSAITNSTGIQLFNSTTTCSTGAAVGSTCTTAAITLPVAYADTNYRLSCMGQGPTNVPIVQTATKSNTTFTITIAALTAAAATFTSYDCSAEHN